ncbi:LytR/AlgR family response regulator transcription factor [Persicitalea jodogahamensis]|uniref:DNA-binding response regulator n=1 Tax=Persicitalea jodogahamensis TaxID=402147 RepID=A0A8J3D3I7_9BACT|nr:LytTR family DNA-binding domain-containing protein [Persicitalea jodogahamensis]GHB54456.1 DNA-binding response regulator [Persicitalea jodogahamensis]
MTTLNCIAVDDEPLALGLVCAFIEKTPFLNLVGRYSSAVEALQGLHEGEVDVLFLDIQMPDLTGIELARVLEKSAGPAGITGSSAPRIIFTTAFNHFALEGFRVDALDYLLKPFNYEEFLRAASKARAYFDLVKKAEVSPGPVVNSSHAVPPEEYLFLRVEYQLVRVAYADILYIEGLKDYVKVHLKKESKPLLSLTSLKSLEEKLPAHRFMRVHRSYIVGLEKIEAISKTSIQIGGTLVPVSDQYKEAFSDYVSRWT